MTVFEFNSTVRKSDRDDELTSPTHFFDASNHQTIDRMTLIESLQTDLRIGRFFTSRRSRVTSDSRAMSAL
jgi:hypothetical protein